MDKTGSRKRGPVGQVQKGSAYFGALGMEVGHFAPLWHLLKVAQLLETELNRISARSNLSISDFHLLCALMMEDDEPVRATDLAHMLNVSDAALSIRVRKLAAMEMVERRDHPQDQRAHLLRIAARGLAAVQDVASAIEKDASFISWFRQLPNEDRQKLGDMLGSFHIFLNRHFLPISRSD